MPQVTSPEPRVPKPKVTADDRRAARIRTAYANHGRRPYTLAEDGWPKPTELEIEEGEAHKVMCEHPGSKLLESEWGALMWRMHNEEGLPATTRCADCHTVMFGRTRAAGCGHCGCHEVYLPVIKRYEHA